MKGNACYAAEWSDWAKDEAVSASTGWLGTTTRWTLTTTKWGTTRRPLGSLTTSPAAWLCLAQCACLALTDTLIWKVAFTVSEIIVKTVKFCFRYVNRTGIIVEGTVHQFGVLLKYRTSQFVTDHEFHNQCYLKSQNDTKCWILVGTLYFLQIQYQQSIEVYRKNNYYCWIYFIPCVLWK